MLDRDYRGDALAGSIPVCNGDAEAAVLPLVGVARRPLIKIYVGRKALHFVFELIDIVFNGADVRSRTLHRAVNQIHSLYKPINVIIYIIYGPPQECGERHYCAYYH